MPKTSKTTKESNKKKKTGMGSEMPWLTNTIPSAETSTDTKSKKTKKNVAKPSSDKKDDITIPVNNEEKVKTKQAEITISGKKIRNVPITSISPDSNQPRKDIKETAEDIKSLADSIRENGFINFITVRESETDKYIIVTGERRYTAAKLVGLKEIPVVIINEKPIDYAIIQLEENLQRKDLSPFEEADTYKRLTGELKLNQDQLAQRTGRDKSYISRILKLADISSDIKKKDKIENTPKEILYELATFKENDQIILWEKLKGNITIANFRKVVEKFKSTKEKNKKEKETEETNEFDPKEVFDLLKKAYSKDNQNIFRFITPKKIETLFKEFGTEKK